MTAPKPKAMPDPNAMPRPTPMPGPNAMPEPTTRAAQVVRVTEFLARPGRVASLIEAASANAASARRQPGCVSAETCTHPDEPERVIVISRWETPDALRSFLSWHQGIAHDSVATSVAAPPKSVHYPVAGALR